MDAATQARRDEEDDLIARLVPPPPSGWRRAAGLAAVLAASAAVVAVPLTGLARPDVFVFGGSWGPVPEEPTTLQGLIAVRNEGRVTLHLAAPEAPDVPGLTGGTARYVDMDGAPLDGRVELAAGDEVQLELRYTGYDCDAAGEGDAVVLRTTGIVPFARSVALGDVFGAADPRAWPAAFVEAACLTSPGN